MGQHKTYIIYIYITCIHVQIVSASTVFELQTHIMYTITLTKDDVNETLKEIRLVNFPGLWNASKVWVMSVKKWCKAS